MIINSNFDFCKYRFVALGASILYIVIALSFFLSKGMNWGIDFQGGAVLEIAVHGKDTADVRAVLKNIGYDNAKVQTVGSSGEQYLIKILPREEVFGFAATEGLKDQLKQSFAGDIEFRKVDYVGPNVGTSLIIKAVVAVAAALLGIWIYVGFRFNFVMGFSAVIALLHDVIAVFCFYVLSGFEFDISSIAVMLIILGYSINDSVVVFDRIREILRKYSMDNYLSLVNLSIHQTLSRTVITSFTTLVVTLSIAIIGGETLRGFSVALCFGILVGTYSTIFIASPFSGMFIVGAGNMQNMQGNTAAATTTQQCSEVGSASKKVRMRKAVN